MYKVIAHATLVQGSYDNPNLQQSPVTTLATCARAAAPAATEARVGSGHCRLLTSRPLSVAYVTREAG